MKKFVKTNFVLLIGIAIFLIGCITPYKYEEAIENGYEVTATITKVEQSETDSDGYSYTSYKLYGEYEVDGKKYTNVKLGTFYGDDGYYKGKKIKVVVDPESPENTIFEGGVLCVIGFLIAIFGLITRTNDKSKKYSLLEFTDKNELSKAYNIYKSCMFMPTEEKFSKKVSEYAADDSVKIFGCLYKNKTVGVVVITFNGEFSSEILGIAVDEVYRHKGVGSYMIKGIAEKYNLRFLFAETDGDGVGFYRKNGFEIKEFTANFNGELVARYRCELIRDFK